MGTPTERQDQDPPKVPPHVMGAEEAARWRRFDDLRSTVGALRAVTETVWESGR